MIAWSLERIAAETGGVAVGDASVTVDAVATDSRQMPRGRPLFIALAGEHLDGHAFVADAVDAGARALLVGRPITEPRVPHVRVDDIGRALARLGAAVRREIDPVAVAVTGSVGKTTVKDLTAAALGVGYRVHAAQASFNNELGVPLTLVGLTHEHTALVAEIGARHLGDVAPLARLVAPDVAVVTAVAAVHLEPFGSIEAVAQTKAELVDALGPEGVAVLNGDYPQVAAMATRAPASIMVGRGGDVRAESVVIDADGHARLTATTPWGEVQVRAPLPGRHQVANVLLALAVAGHLGVDLEAAARAIAAARVSPWRGQVVDARGRTVLDDAYNANPVSMRAALDTLGEIAAGRPATAVLGRMAELGPVAEAEHLGVGAHCATAGVTRLVVVGAEASGITTGARRADVAEVVQVPDPAAAVEWLDAHRLDDEVVLVKASRVAGLDAVVDALVGPTRPAREVADR
jgi:UDP-N-acetylmuramoyl-tripeptide--D-alanyl-D-alanine ligase